MTISPTTRALICGLVLVLLAALLAHRFATIAGTRPDPYLQYFDRPTIDLLGTFRDFQHSGPSAQPDFCLRAPAGPGRYLNIAADALTDDNKPAFRSTGNRVITPSCDAAGHTILMGRDYIGAMAGDHAGQAQPTTGGAVTSAQTFSQWFRTVSGVNTATSGIVTLTRDASARYVFDGPLDHGGAISSNSAGGTTPSCSYEMETTFVHYRNAGWYIEAATDADVWVYIDGKMVVDGGCSSLTGTSIPYSGIVVDGTVGFLSNAELRSATGTTGSVVTNATANGAINLGSGVRIAGNVLGSPGSNPATEITMANNASISGTRGAQQTAVQIPLIDGPPDVGPSVGDVSYAAVTTLAADLHCNNLQILPSNTLRISGNRTIVCDGSFTLGISSSLEILANSSLRLYVGGSVTVKSSSSLNVTTHNPALVTIYVTGGGNISVQSSSGTYANILAPASTLSLASSSTLTGNFIGHSAQLGSRAIFTAVDSGAWINSSGGPQGALQTVTHRIDLDRLDWLTEENTHQLRVFYADRDATPSRFRLVTNIATLGLAALPPSVVFPD